MGKQKEEERQKSVKNVQKKMNAIQILLYSGVVKRLRFGVNFKYVI